MFRALGSNHMDLSSHFDGVVERVDGVTTVVLGATLELALVDAIASWHV